MNKRRLGKSVPNFGGNVNVYKLILKRKFKANEIWRQGPDIAEFYKSYYDLKISEFLCSDSASKALEFYLFLDAKHLFHFSRECVRFGDASLLSFFSLLLPLILFLFHFTYPGLSCPHSFSERSPPHYTLSHHLSRAFSYLGEHKLNVKASGQNMLLLFQ